MKNIDHTVKFFSLAPRSLIKTRSSKKQISNVFDRSHLDNATDIISIVSVYCYESKRYESAYELLEDAKLKAQQISETEENQADVSTLWQYIGEVQAIIKANTRREKCRELTQDCKFLQAELAETQNEIEKIQTHIEKIEAKINDLRNQVAAYKEVVETSTGSEQAEAQTFVEIYQKLVYATLFKIKSFRRKLNHLQGTEENVQHRIETYCPTWTTRAT